MTFDLRTSTVLALVCLLAACLLTGCGAKEKDAPGAVVMSPDEQEAWEIRLVEMRIDKNEEFMDPDKTPLMSEDVPGFRGLNYYWPEASLRFSVPFTAEARPDTIDLVKRKGDVVPYLQKGTVAFSHEGKVHTLAVFGPVDTAAHGDYLWLPFYDATSGTETYPGGRYLDLEVDEAGMIDLDFNFAYNPLCDYNHEKFNCTLPSEGNRLDVAITAGEKLFRLEE